MYIYIYIFFYIYNHTVNIRHYNKNVKCINIHFFKNIDMVKASNKVHIPKKFIPPCRFHVKLK